MRLALKRRFFSLFGDYELYDEVGRVFFSVTGDLAWGVHLHVMDRDGIEVGELRTKHWTFLPKTEVFRFGEKAGLVERGFNWIFPRYRMDYRDWHSKGSLLYWDFEIRDATGRLIASGKRKFWSIRETCFINIPKATDSLDVLLFVLAIFSDLRTG